MKTKRYQIKPAVAKIKDVPTSLVAVPLKETAKAVYLYGHGELDPRGVCARCGRTLTHPGSILIGIGPECLKDWGARKEVLNDLTQDDINYLRSLIINKKIDMWFPKSSITKQEPWNENIQVPADHRMLQTSQTRKYARLVHFKGWVKPAIKIMFPYNKEDVDHVKTLSRRRFHNNGPHDKFWTCPLTIDAVEALQAWDFELDEGLQEFLSKSKIHVDDVEAIDVPGLKMDLYPFQKKGVGFIEAKNGRALIADEMGLGKTAQALAWLQLHPEKRPAIVVVPASLKLNWERECKRWLENPRVQRLSGTKPNKRITGSIIIINYDILPGWLGKLQAIKPKVLIIDECFPAGTKISTPEGDKNIETIREGDQVYNAIGVGTVLKARKRKTKELINLRLSNNKQITVTPNHPFFTDVGWTLARNCRDRCLLTPSDVFNLMPKENEVPGTVRVEGIEILESPSRERSTESTVYNLEVSGHPSYYAEGFLVHNCHYIKNNKAKRTKAVKALGKNIPHVIALSGTPIVNRPVEAYNALKLIDDTVVPNFWEYAQRYCGARHTGFGWDFTGASRTEELHEKLTNTVMIRRRKKDVLTDLPDKTYSIVPIEINNRREYHKAESDFIDWIRRNKGDEAAKKASNAEALAKIEALKQLAVKGKINNALEWIRDFLEVDGKLIAFATHKMTIDILMDEFKNVAVKIDGSTSQQARQDAVDKFQTDDSCRLFVGNIKAAGVGISLTAASNVAFLELPWTPGELEQATDRCHRIGQKNAVNVYYLLAQETIEETIAYILDKKRKVLDKVLDGKEPEESTTFNELLRTYTS